MGGYIALAMAEQGAARLKGFGLLHSTAFADSTEKLETRRKAIAFIREYGSHAFLKTAIPGLFSESWQQAYPQAVQALVNKGASFLPEALVSYYEAMMARPDRTELLRTTTLPVLFIIGVHDKAAPMQDVLQQVSLPAISQVSILEHTAHMGMLEEPEKFHAATAHFLQLWA
jgi:pimeloyl-ACP methyl ester carboxylesterase